MTAPGDRVGKPCSAPGCSAVAVLSWQRSSSPAEAQAHIDFLQAGQRALVEARAGMLDLQVAELTSMRDRLVAEGRLTPGAQGVLEQQIASKQTARDNVVAPVVFAAGDVTVAVFGCDTHSVGPDRACWLHQADCFVSSATCSCVEPAVPAASAVPAPVVEPGPPVSLLGGPAVRGPRRPAPHAAGPGAGHAGAGPAVPV
jgi:hypothetical protein